MGPKGAKIAPNAPKCPENDPESRKKAVLRKATLSPFVWTPNYRVATLQLKNGQKWAPGSRNGPKRGK